ncbi:MAG: PipX family protein [Synechococcales cyanobacterium]
MPPSHPLARAPVPAAELARPSTRPQENYLNHPTFGLLYGLCGLGTTAGLFTTLYAQRLFFRVAVNADGEMTFEPLGRQEARQLVEEQLRQCRRLGQKEELTALQTIYQRTFV